MNDRVEYAPSPAHGARVEKNSAQGGTQARSDNWTLILVRQLKHSPEKVWRALTEPGHLREWAPFVVDGNLGTVGSVTLTWVETAQAVEAKVTRSDPHKALDYGDMRWELEPMSSGTRLTLWHKIDRRFVSWGAAGWHICFDVLDRLLTGEPIGRISGRDAMKINRWQQLTVEYGKLLEVEVPKLPPSSSQKS